MMKRLLSAAALMVLVGAAGEAPAPRGHGKDTPPRPPVWQRLERFENDADFLRYVREIARINNWPSYRDDEDVAADSAAPPPMPPPPPPPPPPAPGMAPPAAAELSASAAQPSAGEPSSIINVQTQGVDEGGIVKQVGRFLIVLQDGRLFVVNTRPGEASGLELSSRTNVYRSPNADTWYDELLTSGNRVLVTGYSYREQASEVTVFTIDDSGQLTREATYYITSNDYYDIENYSTRLVNGNLVIYTPLAISSINATQMRWPVIRRWLRDGERQAVTTEGRALFDGNDIYKPVQATLQPLVHSVSVCPLGELSAGDELDCRTTAFVGGAQREFFVSTSDIFLWVTPNDWDSALNRDCARPGAAAASLPATIFQVPLSGETPRALHARGRPSTQLALDATSEEFRALLKWNVGPCANSGGAAQVRYFHAPLSAFREAPRDASPRSYVAAPSPEASQYEVRYTRTHVVYGGRTGWSSYPPEPNTTLPSSRVIALPLTNPAAATIVQAPHNIIRLERAGNNAILSGYRTDRGLSLSVLDLEGTPRIVSTQVLDGRYESEGRSHAFNALVGADDSGVMGLPTVTRTWEGGRWWFRSRASDVSYLTLSSAGRLSWAGQLVARQDAQDPSYRCEVSCIDWYGNTRALFIGNRIFGLSGTELIEGALANGRIRETRRLNLSSPPPRA